SLQGYAILSSIIALFLFNITLFTTILIYPTTFPFQNAHFLLPSTEFSLFPPAPLPFFALVTTVLSTISIGTISDRTLSSPHRHLPSQRGPNAMWEDRWRKTQQRIQRNVSCMNYINLLYVALQMLNLRSGYNIHLPAGLYLNGLIVELKIFSSLLMYIYDHTKLSNILLRIM
ncbi:hypothetical protein PFISCL1PPCAC_20231, partial [Pristionchus fissidentatus]